MIVGGPVRPSKVTLATTLILLLNDIPHTALAIEDAAQYARMMRCLSLPRARARARRVVPISGPVYGALTKNSSSLEPSRGAVLFAVDFVDGRRDRHNIYVRPDAPQPFGVPRRLFRGLYVSCTIHNARGAGNRRKSKRSLVLTFVEYDQPWKWLRRRSRRLTNQSLI